LEPRSLVTAQENNGVSAPFVVNPYKTPVVIVPAEENQDVSVLLKYNLLFIISVVPSETVGKYKL